jgi:hypothetical protein
MKDMRKVYNVIFGLAAIMALVGNRVPGDGEHWVITSLSLSLLLLVLLSVALSRVHSSRANRNATELRALAEGLRVQNVWRQAGIARAVSPLSAPQPRQYRLGAPGNAGCEYLPTKRGQHAENGD